MTKGEFDASADAWRAWRESPWGRLRYSVAEFNLRRTIAQLDGPALRVLDLGGGDGGDALPLLRDGRRVTVVDSAAGMLAGARERARRAGLEGELRTVEADVRALPETVTAERFDVVLCHNVLQYVDDPGAVVRDAASLVRGGGVLSVMAVNRYARPLSLAVRSLDPAAALEAMEARTVQGVTFGAELTLFTAEEITALMSGAGCTEIEHCGIRCVNDHIADDGRKHDPDFFAALERLERAMTNRHPYPHTAKLFQLVARVPDVSGCG